MTMDALKKIEKGELEDIISRLREKEDENHFLLTYLLALRWEDYKLYRFKETFIANIKGLVTSLSYTPVITEEMKKIIEQIPSRMIIIPGPENTKMLRQMAYDEIREENLMAYEKKEEATEYPSYILNTLNEYMALQELYDEIEEYRSYYSQADMVKKFRSRDSRHIASAIKEDGKVVSSLFINDGLIVSVGTIPGYRNRGLATRNVSSAIYHYFTKNIDEYTVYLFYNNEKARKIYLKIGFHDVCPFIIIKRRTHEIRKIH